MHLMYAGFNCTDTPGIAGCVSHLIHDRSLISQAWAWFTAHGHEFWAWMKQPYVLAVIFAWWITFAVVVTIMLGIGFGPAGIGAGTVAAVIQSVAYGALTPAGGIFATLTSVAMTGGLFWPAAVSAAILATVVAGIVWCAGVRR